MEEKVESVKIETEKPMLNECITMSLTFSPHEEHWISDELFVPADQHEAFRYRYVVKWKEGIKEWLYKTFISGKDVKTLREIYLRKLSIGKDQYDIFHKPGDQRRMKTIFSGQLFFVKRLYYLLGRGGNLKEMLIECEQTGFGHPSYSKADIQTVIHWVGESIESGPTDDQGVYLSALLGQLVTGTRTQAHVVCNLLEKKMADKLLSYLPRYSYEALPKSSTTSIKAVAEHVFNAGSSIGCLPFIKFFCNLLDVNYVMQVADKLSSRFLKDNQFDQQVESVVASVTRMKDPDSGRRFCCFMINHSPSVECLWNLYSVIACTSPDRLKVLEEEFTIAYRKFTSRKRTKKPDLLQPCFWSGVPEKLKEKLADPFCEVLFEQVSRETSYTHERSDSLKNIVLDPRLQLADTFCRLVTIISSHKSEKVVSMILSLLESKELRTCWVKRFSREDKLKISWNWVRSQYAGKRPTDQILAVVEACEILCETEAVKNDDALCLALQEQVEKMVLKGSFQSIMNAVVDAQNRSPTIFTRLVYLFRKAIKKESGSGDRRSKYKNMIRLLGYDHAKERKKRLQKVKLDR